MSRWSIANLIAFTVFGLAAQDLPQLEQWIRAERFQDALPGLEAYVREHPESSEAAYKLGYVYFRVRRMNDAVKSLSACLARSPGHADAHRVLGFALTALGRADLAEREFVRSLQAKPDLVGRRTAW